MWEGRDKVRKLCRGEDTQGLEDAGGLPGGADWIEVQWQGQVVAWDGQEALGLQGTTTFEGKTEQEDPAKPMEKKQ